MKGPKIRCLAVDDEPYAAKIIADFIGKVPFLELAGIATSGLDALTAVRNGDIDLVFLDILMPDLTGIEFLKLCGKKCKVILTTGYSEYALQGYELDVVDYLLKPVAFERFMKAVNKISDIMHAGIMIDKASNQGMLPIPNDTNKAQQKSADYIFIKSDSKNKFIKVNFADILYIEGLKNYILVSTKDQRLITYTTLKDFELQLPSPPFYRVHKSFIVSLEQIKLVNGNTIYIHDYQIPIGETYKEFFFKMVREV
ncbi:LytTR family DNA-binding domain-containing protein [Mucilaginibacter sp.]|uniref:LytR/AlgR family response regulator transcription factor n=1 Tax=Mucilaginibacter sp. TaxID=1882438 RepID=UPI0025EE7537|nr:LytTR family DNA-binding domain-containing protein [Mucilaginibacter sp.]